MYKQIYNLTGMFFKRHKGNLMYEFLISKFIKQIVTLVSYKTFILFRNIIIGKKSFDGHVQVVLLEIISRAKACAVPFFPV